MPEYSSVVATCPECDWRWFPFGTAQKLMPLLAPITCPKCHHRFEGKWLDSESAKKMVQKELGLNVDGKLGERVKQLETRFQILEKAHEVEEKKLELNDAEITVLKTWSKKREKDFEDIERLAEELREDERYREKNK